MTHVLAIHSRRPFRRRAKAPAISVDATAAAPNTGHAHPKIAGFWITAFAMTGTNVAGMM